MTDFAPEEAHGSTDLLHLLTCPACRSWAIGRLLDQSTAPEHDDTQPDLYAGMWARLEERTPEMIEEVRHRRERIERLLGELMQAPAGRRLGLVQQLRFRSLDFPERLLEESHAGQLPDPARAGELARLAARLASHFETGDEEAAAALPRAYCLGANARRLENRPQAAEALLAKAARCLSGRMERAFYCRTLALLRWEQGRADEAAALLQHAACLFAADGPHREVGCCLTLLGLVLQEESDEGEALPLLSRGWAEMDRDGRPLLALRAGLALAACLALAEQPERARGVLREAWRFFAEVTDPQEMVRVYWWEGRALALLGEREEGLNVLESVRRQLIEEPSPAEAALVSLDLALALAEGGRPEAIEALAEALHTSFSTVAVMPLVAENLRALAILARRGEPGLHTAAHRTAANLRRMFRSYGLRIKPLPFA
jgi:tetratricopeptide (TPR) repeat protein